jgi:hypothetical protein
MSEGQRRPQQYLLLTRGRVVASALRQAARHERALLACLTELDGTDAPSPGLVRMTQRRAQRHLERAAGLIKTAMRLNADDTADAFIAAVLERQERLTLRVERVLWAARVCTLSAAS